MAEGLIRARIDAEGLGDRITVASAGTWAAPDRPATEHAVTVMARRGVDISGHASREVTGELLEWADLVLVMTEGHEQGVLADFPASRAKVRLLSTLAGGRWDVADPVGNPVEDYDATAVEIARLIDAGWDVIRGDRPAS